MRAFWSWSGAGLVLLAIATVMRLVIGVNSSSAASASGFLLGIGIGCLLVGAILGSLESRLESRLKQTQQLYPGKPVYLIVASKPMDDALELLGIRRVGGSKTVAIAATGFGLHLVGSRREGVIASFGWQHLDPLEVGETQVRPGYPAKGPSIIATVVDKEDIAVPLVYINSVSLRTPAAAQAREAVFALESQRNSEGK